MQEVAARAHPLAMGRGLAPAIRHLLTPVSVEPDLEVVGQAGNASDALAAIEACSPDVAILDVRLGDGNGIEVCREIRSAFPDISALMLTSFTDDRALVDAAMAGASGFVLKQIHGNEIISSVRG